MEQLIEESSVEECRYNKEYKSLYYYYRSLGKRNNPNPGITDLDISDAKGYPIDILIKQGGIPINRQGNIICPNHREKTPSCHIYKESNMLFCFGCSASFDTISYIRSRYECGFIEAVKMILGR